MKLTPIRMIHTRTTKGTFYYEIESGSTAPIKNVYITREGMPVPPLEISVTLEYQDATDKLGVG